MKTIFTYGGKNPFDGAKVPDMITVEQSAARGKHFRVTYGLQQHDGLTYTEACKEIGQCILHHLCCEGIASNEGD